MKDKNPVVSAEIAESSGGCITCRLEYIRNLVALRVADLDRNPAFGFKKPCRLGGDDPVGVQPIHTAIQGQAWVEIADLVLQISNVL